jgi:very-short-patch-repair endonuclease
MNAHDQSLALWAATNSDLKVILRSPEYKKNIYKVMLRNCNSMDGKEVAFNCRSLMLLNPINNRALANLLISLFHRANIIRKLLPQDAIPICQAYHYFKVTVDLSAVDIGPIQLRSKRGTRDTTSSTAQTEITAYLNTQLEAKDRLQEEVLLHVIPVDMYCKNKRIAVEVDGSQHRIAKKQRKDRLRDRIRQRNGITTIRLDLVNYNRRPAEEKKAILNQIAKAVRSNKLTSLEGLPSLSVHKAIEKPGAGLFKQGPKKRKRETVDQPSIAKAAYQ